ncbi:MAG: glycogen synthase GlgA [Myxococcales bacterium]|nr:glycogen synthase GlgA [Myxococcales bacterium]
MKLLFVASELAPFAKTGGLADVLAALPRHLHRAGHDVRVVVPLYDTIDFRGAALAPVVELLLPLGEHRYSITIFTTAAAPPTYFVHCPALFGRGRLYTSDADEHRRFLALSYAALHLCQRLDFAPDVVHCHDWQAALIPLLLKTTFARDPRLARAKSLLTIHNLNYQGSFPASIGPDTNLTHLAHLFHQELLQAGRVNFLLQGILYADGVSTVSPTYAQEIQTPAHGAGLDGFLRARSSTVVGILNGVDYDEWSPERDTYIPARYSAADRRGKELDKQALLEALGLPYAARAPVIGVVSRLVSQKGFDLLGAVMPGLLQRHGFQLTVLGSGEPGLEDMFARLQRAFPRQVCFYQGFNNKLAHLIEAGADMFLMPSRYEPCGLNQLYSLRYGTVPIVHKTGGLADTVRPWHPRTGTGTGFLFEHHDAAGVRWAVQAALATYRDRPAWSRLVDNGMAEDFSWDRQTALYETLYTRLVDGGRGRRGRS